MSGARPLRSVLFVPGNRPRMLEKARSLPADAVLLDLEDAVPPGEKVAARGMLRQALNAGGYRPRVIVRLNVFTTGLAEQELEDLWSPSVEAICLPKVEQPADVERMAALLRSLEQRSGRAEGDVPLFLMIESALGVIRAFDLARASSRVHGLFFGGEDLARDLGAVRTKEGQELSQARAQILLAARAAGIVAIDTIYTDLADPDGLLAEARLARQLGYSGKLVVHPDQIEVVHRAFAPTEQEISYARRVLEAFAAAEARGQGVIALDGQMIDAPVVSRAREIVAVAQPGQGEIA